MLEKTMKSYLSDLLDLRGVILTLIIARDGFIIESAMKSDIPLESLSAVASAGFGSSVVMGEEMNLSDLNQTIFEFDQGKIVLTALGDQSILAVVTNNNAIIGNIRHNMIKIVRRLADFF